ncbi:tetratricopeptide repeat protein [bacterium]|nr:tetratricopeptide repeat protein [bacterium]MCP5462089.1 tetratricopeptide repeat protein [bacterium]
MIIKNQEKHNASYLEKIKPLVNEIIVVDDGLSDSTISSARQSGATVYDSRIASAESARNYALSKAQYEWILVLDSDETISQNDFSAIQKVIQNENRSAYAFYLHTYTDDPEQEDWHACPVDCPDSKGFIGYLQSDVIRLFRNRINIRYLGHAGELFEESIKHVPKKHSEIIIHSFELNNDREELREKRKEYISQLVLDYKAEPESFSLNLLLGQEYIRLGEAENAVKHLMSAIEIREDWRALYALGMAYIKMERYSYAVKQLERAVRINPRYAETYYGLAVSALSVNQNKEAVSALRRFCQLNPQNVKGINVLGYIYYRQGMYGLAEKVFREALRIHPKYTHAQRNIISLLYDKGDIMKAEQESRRLLEICPSDREWINSLATR